MQRSLTGLAAGLLVLTGACGTPPADDSTPLDTTQTGDTTSQEPADDVADRSQGGDADAGTTGPGVPLQTILAQSAQRDPQTQDLLVLDELDEAQWVSVETQQNRHYPDRTDTLRTHAYDGLQLTVHHASGKEILENVIVTGDQYTTDDVLTVGMTRSELESVRGQPEQRQDGTYVYDLGGPMPTMLHVSFGGDEVSRLEWRYPID